MEPFKGTRVILWSEQPVVLDAVGQALSSRGCRIRSVDSLEQLREEIAENGADLILAQLCYCFREPLELLRHSKPTDALPPVLIVTSASQVPLYVEAMREGAFDCVSFPVDEKELIHIASRALGAQHL